jgi:hypothetical protein
MKVSVAWLAVSIVILILLVFTVQGFSIYDQLKDVITDMTEGFETNDMGTELQIKTCPADTAFFIDVGGRHMCCEGTISDGKCVGNTICSLSESIAGVPTCSSWYDAYLETKGATRCPPSMKRYYENNSKDKKGLAGCTSGNRNKSGTAPDVNNTNFCNLYNSEKDELLKLDSCSNKKFFEETRCFSRPMENLSKQFANWGDIPPPITCSALDKGGLIPLTCLDDSSFVRSIDYWVKQSAPNYRNWKEQAIGWGPQWKLNFCSVIQKVSIDKTLSFKDLESYKVF